MAPKLVTFLVIFIANAAICIFWWFFLLLALNGFREAEAFWGIAAYCGWALVVTIVTSGLGALLVHLLMKRWGFGPLSSSLIAVPVFVVIGGAINFFGIIVGAIVADAVRSGS
jgi:hypothetical protein